MNIVPPVIQKQSPPALQTGGSFGFATRFLSGLEKRPLAELLFKDVLAFNVPKISLTRTWAECLDTATLELANSSITLLSSLAVPPLLRRPASWLSGIPMEKLNGVLSKTANTPVKLARLGIAFGFLFPFAAAFWAIPFFRNWLTMERTQSGDFESMIGFKDKGKEQQKPTRSFEEEKDYHKNKALNILLTGVSLGVASLVGLSTAARRMANAGTGSLWGKARNVLENRYGKAWENFANNYDLKGESANQVAPGGAQLLFWGLPAYVGWIHAARGNNERRERTLQAFNGMFWFFFGGKLTGMLFKRSYAKLEAVQPTFWRKEFLEKIAGQPLPADNWHAHFEANPTWTKALRDSLENLSYAEIEENALDKTSKAFDSLIKMKNRKFAISGLATPIIALALVQGLNFYITARKLKPVSPALNPSSPAEPASLPPEAFPPPFAPMALMPSMVPAPSNSSNTTNIIALPPPPPTHAIPFVDGAANEHANMASNLQSPVLLPAKPIPSPVNVTPSTSSSGAMPMFSSPVNLNVTSNPSLALNPYLKPITANNN
jgi:hypothetical protein